MNKKVFFSLMFAAIIFITAVVAGGCSQAPESAGPSQGTAQREESATEVSEEPDASPTVEATPAPEASEEPEPDYAVIGEEGPETKALILTNETGNAITGLEVKTGEEKEFEENLIDDSTRIAPDETVKFFCDITGIDQQMPPEDAPIEEATEDNGAEAEFLEYYTIRLTFENGDSYELYDFSPFDLTEFTILFDAENEVCYIKYVSDLTGDTVNTKEAQTAMKNLLEEEAARQQAEEEEKSASKPKPTPEPEPDPEPEPEQYFDDCLDENVDWLD